LWWIAVGSGKETLSALWELREGLVKEGRKKGGAKNGFLNGYRK